MNKPLILLTLLKLLTLGYTQFAVAASETQLHGFINQALIKTTDNQFFGDSESGSTEFTELGLNVSRRLTPHLQVSAQVLSRDAGKTDDGSLRVDFALIDYEFYSNENSVWGVRAGRLKNPFGFYNETRDVAHTRPGILLPQSQYLDRARMLFLSSDSLAVYNHSYNDFAEFSFTALAGYPLADSEELETEYLLADWGGDLESNAFFLSQFELSINGGQWRYLLNLGELNFKFTRDADFLYPIATAPFAITDPGNGRAKYRPVLLGIQHQAENWHLTAELLRYKIKNRDYQIATNPIFADNKYTAESVYLQLGYIINDSWEVLVRRDEFYLNNDDRDGKKLAAATTQLPAPFGPLSAHNFYSKTNTISLRWNINPNFMLQAEYHNIEGTYWLPALDNPDKTITTKYWDMFIVSASYYF